jgi:hypothetical protein
MVGGDIPHSSLIGYRFRTYISAAAAFAKPWRALYRNLADECTPYVKDIQISASRNGMN